MNASAASALPLISALVPQPAAFSPFPDDLLAPKLHLPSLPRPHLIPPSPAQPSTLHLGSHFSSRMPPLQCMHSTSQPPLQCIPMYKTQQVLSQPRQPTLVYASMAVTTPADRGDDRGGATDDKRPRRGHRTAGTCHGRVGARSVMPPFPAVTPAVLTLNAVSSRTCTTSRTWTCLPDFAVLFICGTLAQPYTKWQRSFTTCLALPRSDLI